MRKLIVLGLAVAFLVAGTAQADNSTGCGLGSMLFEGKSGVFPQILAVTTNGTLGNQTFGISSGTLGCDPKGTVVYNAAVQRYMGERLDPIAADMSQGGGEDLDALAGLIGVTDEDKAAFFQLTKSNFEKIFPTAETTAEEALLNLQVLMSADDRMMGYLG
ncbi:MAG: DUF3015 domain-containing protein [bacterium]|nr:DUF3015 domain-containing protein [bacterium]